MSENQDLANIFNGLELGGKIKLVQKSCPLRSWSGAYSPDWGLHTQDFCRAGKSVSVVQFN